MRIKIKVFWNIYGASYKTSFFNKAPVRASSLKSVCNYVCSNTNNYKLI